MRYIGASAPRASDLAEPAGPPRCASYSGHVRRDEAEREAERLNREQTHGSTHRWFARADSERDWSLVKVAGLAALVDPLKATIEAKPRPPQPDDPRPSHSRIVGGPYG